MKREQKARAYAHIENIYRQIWSWERNITRMDFRVYYEGLAKNAAYFKHNLDTLSTALDTVMVGKYNHTNPVERDQVATILMKRRVSDGRA